MNPLPPAPINLFRSAMLERPRALVSWLGRRWFDHIEVDPETADRLRALPNEGQLIYVMRTRSTLDYLFFNYLYLKIGLPLARFANGMDLVPFRGIKVWLGDAWERLLQRQPRQPRRLEQLEMTVQANQSALLFMKARGLTSERATNPGYIERLVALQRTREQPILLLPQHISWPRKPPSKRRTWLDILFGQREASGRLRKLIHFVRGSRLASVQVGDPINLQQVLADHEGWSDKRIARKVRRVLFIHLARESMAISGPGIKPPGVLQRELLERRAFRQDLANVARQMGQAPDASLDQARRYLKEISAALNFEVILVLGRILDFVFKSVFKGVEVDAAGMRRVKEAAKHSRRAPLILVPSHKSHADYLVISWVFLRNEFVPPHIAAGINLSFFPMGSILRRGGAFFLRRSFTGQHIYKLVFRRYLWKLLREGYPVEFFMEGGRSRTGKLLPPKLGMLSMLLEGVRSGEYKDLQFVPINLSYERVFETGAYQRELTGGQKKTESIGDVMRAGRILSSRYGRVYVSFEEPVRLSEYLAKQDRGTLNEQSEDDFRDFTTRLAYHLMRQIQEATVVSPSSLVGAVLLSHHRRGLSGTRLREMVGFLLDLLKRREARLSASIQKALTTHAPYIEKAAEQNPKELARARGEALRPLIEEALALLRKLIKGVERGGDTIYTVPDRIELDYYRNPILGILAPECIVATVLLAAEGPISRERLADECKRLSYWFRLEFIYETDNSFEENFRETLERLREDQLVDVTDEGTCVVQAPLTLDFMRGMIIHLVEGYWIAADALRALVDNPMDRKDWLSYAREHGEKEYLQGDIRRAEAASTAVLANALGLFIAENLVQVSTRGTGRRASKVLSLTPGRSLEDLAFRRDDLGAYLLRNHDDPLRASTAAFRAVGPAPVEPSRRTRPSGSAPPASASPKTEAKSPATPDSDAIGAESGEPDDSQAKLEGTPRPDASVGPVVTSVPPPKADAETPTSTPADAAERSSQSAAPPQAPPAPSDKE